MFLESEAMACPPPPLRDHRLDLVTLSVMARTFDQISREDGGQLWPATAFVEGLADEVRACSEANVTDAERRVAILAA
jgi:hypothetical protein